MNPVGAGLVPARIARRAMTVIVLRTIRATTRVAPTGDSMLRRLHPFAKCYSKGDVDNVQLDRKYVVL